MHIILTNEKGIQQTISRSSGINREFHESILLQIRDMKCIGISFILTQNKIVRFLEPYVPILQGRVPGINITSLEIQGCDFKMSLCNDLYSIFSHVTCTIKTFTIRLSIGFKTTTGQSESDLFRTFRKNNCLNRITHLEIINCKVSIKIDDLIHILDKTPNSIRKLTINRCDLSNNDILCLKVFLETSTNCHLKSLVINDNAIGSCGILLLCQNIHLTQLTHVDIVDVYSDWTKYHPILHTIERRIFSQVESFAIGGFPLKLDQLNITFQNIQKCQDRLKLKQLRFRNLYLSDSVVEFFIQECPKIPIKYTFENCTMNPDMVTAMLVLDTDQYYFSNLRFPGGMTESLNNLNKFIAKRIIEDKKFFFGFSESHGSRMNIFLNNYKKWRHQVCAFVYAYLAAVNLKTTSLSGDYLLLLLEYMFPKNVLMIPSY